MTPLSAFLMTVVLCLSAPPMLVSAADDSAEKTLDYVQVADVADDQLSLDVAQVPFNDCKSTDEGSALSTCRQLHLVVKDTVVKDRLKTLHKGDRIKITYLQEKDQNVLTQFCLDRLKSSVSVRIFVLVVTTLACVLFGVFWTRSNPLRLIIGLDGRYSNSKFQIALWFLVLVVTYLSTLWMRVWFAGCDFIEGVSIPQNLLLVSGMSVITYGGAKAITQTKVADEKAKPDGNQDPKNSANAAPNFFKDLTHDDGKAAQGQNPAVPAQLDFGDFQMLMITLIAVATYLVVAFNFLGTIQLAKSVSLPDLDNTILATFGLGHGAYLVKKAAGGVGQS